MCVVGVGSIGQHHVRILSSMRNVKLVGVVDGNVQKAGLVASRFGVKCYQSISELMDSHSVDAAVVSVPTVMHEAVACELMSRGVSVLVEKPIAIDLLAADRVISTAKLNLVTLAVGHVERYNAAVIELKKRLSCGDLGEVFHIETRRQGPFPSHVKDIGVVMDLAVHDLDLIRFISGQEITEVLSRTERRLHESHEDFVRGIMRLSDGAMATISIDWLTPTKIREISVTGERGMYRVDLLTQDLYFFENSAVPSEGWESMDVLRGINEGRMIRYPVHKKEPLLAELEDFVDSVIQKKEPLVTGNDGRYALQLAQTLLSTCQ